MHFCEYTQNPKHGYASRQDHFWGFVTLWKLPGCIVLMPLVSGDHCVEICGSILQRKQKQRVVFKIQLESCNFVCVLFPSPAGNHTCFVCKKASLDTRRCSSRDCGRFYHEACIKPYPNTRYENNTSTAHCMYAPHAWPTTPRTHESQKVRWPPLCSCPVNP